MKNLQKICIRNICFNLVLNFQICKKHNLKIPSKIGDRILEFSIKYWKEINDDEVKIFQKEIMDLSKFSSISNNFNVKNYDFLSNHQFDDVKLENLENFNIESSNFRIKLKNLHIYKIKSFEINDLAYRKLFIKNRLEIEDSIKFECINLPKDLNLIPLFNKNIIENLRKLFIFKCSFTEMSLISFFFNYLPFD